MLIKLNKIVQKMKSHQTCKKWLLNAWNWPWLVVSVAC